MSLDPYQTIDTTPEAKAAFDHAIKRSTSDLKPPGETKTISQVDSYDYVVKRLAELPRHEYDRIRAEEAKALQVRVTTLDDAVKALALRNEQTEADSPFAEVEPHPCPIDPAQLLDDVSAAILQFIILDSEQVSMPEQKCTK